VRSYELGLFGIADVVQQKRDAPPVPIEYKRGRSKRNDCDRVQLCAQALCLEEMMARPVPQGELFYGKPRRRVVVEMSVELRRLTIDSAKRLHALLESRRTPPADPGPKCDRCSLQSLCLPRLKRHGSARAAFDYILESLVPDPTREGTDR
jgi:CRISPR-associated exonuclease Cas4